jgi:hypothetical protein
LSLELTRPRQRARFCLTRRPCPPRSYPSILESHRNDGCQRDHPSTSHPQKRLRSVVRSTRPLTYPKAAQPQSLLPFYYLAPTNRIPTLPIITVAADKSCADFVSTGYRPFCVSILYVQAGAFSHVAMLTYQARAHWSIPAW